MPYRLVKIHDDGQPLDRRSGAAPLRGGELASTGESEPGYSALVAFDIVGYGSRTEQLQYHVREAMYLIVKRAFTDARLPWPPSPWRDDRGDGLRVALTYAFMQPLIESCIPHLYRGLRRHNDVSIEGAKIELRMAAHAGHVTRDEHGLTGAAMVHLHRLLDAPAFKQSVARCGATLGVVASQRVYNDVIRPGRGLIDPEEYSPMLVVNKETRAEAWVHLLYHRHHDPIDLAPAG